MDIPNARADAVEGEAERLGAAGVGAALGPIHRGAAVPEQVLERRGGAVAVPAAGEGRRRRRVPGAGAEGLEFALNVVDGDGMGRGLPGGAGRVDRGPLRRGRPQALADVEEERGRRFLGGPTLVRGRRGWEARGGVGFVGGRRWR